VLRRDNATRSQRNWLCKLYQLIVVAIVVVVIVSIIIVIVVVVRERTATQSVAVLKVTDRLDLHQHNRLGSNVRWHIVVVIVITNRNARAALVVIGVVRRNDRLHSHNGCHGDNNGVCSAGYMCRSRGRIVICMLGCRSGRCGNKGSDDSFGGSRRRWQRGARCRRIAVVVINSSSSSSSNSSSSSRSDSSIIAVVIVIVVVSKHRRRLWRALGRFDGGSHSGGNRRRWRLDQCDSGRRFVGRWRQLWSRRLRWSLVGRRQWRRQRVVGDRRRQRVLSAARLSRRNSAAARVASLRLNRRAPLELGAITAAHAAAIVARQRRRHRCIVCRRNRRHRSSSRSRSSSSSLGALQRRLVD
jgi:hypothetical protein